MKIALLSNVNIDPVNRMLKGNQDVEVYNTQGYGNELGVLLNKQSSFYEFNPEMVFVVVDLMEAINHNIVVDAAKEKINEWFTLFENSIQSHILYFVSDAYLYGTEMETVWDKNIKMQIEYIWMERLMQTMETHANVRLLNYNGLVQKIGESSTFSLKMWYMGKILHTTAFHKVLVEEIVHKIDVEKRTPKKVLLLDLDNTLWRGIAGEHDITPIVLSDDGVGLAYKNFQRGIKQLKLQGVILGIVSKNNEADALNIIANHPHMVLREEDFAITKINWVNKAANIAQIAQELNVGLDSMVFIDDNPVERTLVKETLKNVIVPEFPERPEELTSFLTTIYHDFFEKSVITKEDREKTSQYRANSERKKLLDMSVDFDGYLESLEMKISRVSAKKNSERFLQLMNKTNQFNLTTKRFSEQEAAQILESENDEVFLYRVTDKFGDNGIVVAAIVEFGEQAKIIEFTMSCRVMGRKIEEAIVEDMENAARARGYNEMIGIYKPTEKNKPVENLYSSLGYEKVKDYEDGGAEHAIDLNKSLTRNYRLTRVDEEN